MGRKPASRPPNPIDDGPMLKMKELVEATGLTKATILYYISEKLLPPPVKTGRNVAFYPSSFIEKTKLIRQLQSEHRLSLSQIKTILKEKDKGKDIDILIDFQKEIYGEKEDVKYTRQSICIESGLSAPQLKKAISLQLIIPQTDSEFDNEDLVIARRLKEFLDYGLSLEDLAHYPEAISGIIDKDMEIRLRLLNELSYYEALNRTLTITKGVRVFRNYISERIFQKKAAKQPLLPEQPEDKSPN